LPSSSEAKELCAAINREIDRLTEITEDYLQMGRLPKPKLQVEAVAPVVTALVDFVREDLLQRGVAVTLTVESTAHTNASIDSGQLRQCVLNLVRNAADAVAGQADAKVDVKVCTKGQVVEITVHDNGPGIPLADQSRVFDPFFSTKQGGSGLGLALTQQIVRDHGGSLQVSPEPGGATFVISLPLLTSE
jgi:signal transduction histidine kinase